MANQNRIFKDATLTVEIADGKAPYTYTLFWEDYPEESVKSYGSYHTFETFTPGWHSIRIEDANGWRAETKYVELVETRPLKIVRNPQDATITYAPGVFPSASFSVKAEGAPGHLLTYQ